MNHVDQPHAQLLKEAGWGKSQMCRDLGTDRGIKVRPWPELCDVEHADILPAPNLSELLDQIEFKHLKTYWWAVDEKSDPLEQFDEWLYETMKDPNALARIWVWKEGK